MRILVVAFLLVASILGYAVWSRPVEIARYRIDVVMQTPSGDVKGTGVVGIFREKTFDPSGVVFLTRMRGEAIPIDLGGGRAVWMTLGHRGFDWPDMAPWLGSDRMVRGSPNRMKADLVPKLVMFADERDPRTVQIASMGSTGSTLGPSYSLKGVFVSNTSLDITRGITERLPWIPSLEGNLRGEKEIGTSMDDEDPARYMSKKYFVRGYDGRS